MPRAMVLFRKAGLNPIPAPTGHLVISTPPSGRISFFPSSGNLEKSERAFYEFLGLVWAKLRGQI